jgi:N-formylglutamate amidohydrolase
MAPAPFRVSGRLDGGSPLLLSSPHSGRWLGPGFRSAVPLAELRGLEDAHVGRLVAPAARASHAPLVEATHARALIDLNRSEDEYDPAMLLGQLGVAPRATHRVRAGFGLVPRLAPSGQPIHSDRLPAGLVMERIVRLHRPFHAALADGLAAARARHGVAVLLDCHSMPALPRAGADVVLGDCNGTAAAAWLTACVRASLEAEGLKVALNQPYAGGHIVARHGRPDTGVHALQIEFDRALYMDATLVPHGGFARLAAMFIRVVAAVLDLPALAADRPQSLAAE